MTPTSRGDKSKPHRSDVTMKDGDSHAWIVEALAAMIHYSEDRAMNDIADPLIAAMEVVAPKIAAQRKAGIRKAHCKLSDEQKSAKVVLLHQ